MGQRDCIGSGCSLQRLISKSGCSPTDFVGDVSHNLQFVERFPRYCIGADLQHVRRGHLR